MLPKMEEEKEAKPNSTDSSKVREVFARVVFLKVGEIDTVAETYEADVIIQAKWREPVLDHSTTRDLDSKTTESLWNPGLQVLNFMVDKKPRLTTEVEFNSKREAFVIETRRLRGSFSEHLELQNFPFDVQDLSLILTTERKAEDVVLLENEKELSRINPMGFLDVQEWELRDYIETTEDFNIFNEIFGYKKKYATLTFNFAAFRRPGFFVWNIIFIMALIGSLSLTSFAVKLDLPQHRLQLTFTLLLTAVAFKFVVAQSLPKIPYLTYLDKHILGIMIILYMVCVWHAVLTILDGTYNIAITPTLDLAAFVIFGLVFILFHVVFGLAVYFTSRARKNEIYEAEKVYQAKALAVFGESYNKLKRTVVRRNIRRSKIDVIVPII